jgi:hypothetical protein
LLQSRVGHTRQSPAAQRKALRSRPIICDSNVIRNTVQAAAASRTKEHTAETSDAQRSLGDAAGIEAAQPPVLVPVGLWRLVLLQLLQALVERVV